MRLALFSMDRISADVIVNVILPLLPKHALVALLHTSKRYYQLVLSCFPYVSRNRFEILEEICKRGYVNLLRWFIGRGNGNLQWSLLIGGVRKLLRCIFDGNYFMIVIFIFSTDFIFF